MNSNLTVAVKRSNCIGRFYIVFAPELGRRVLANCIDATPDDRPKRMRIQRCSMNGGDVLMPGSYDIIEVDPQWAD